MRRFKKILAASCALLLATGILAGCSSKKTTSDGKNIEKLTIGFVPSRDPKDIITATEPLKELLKTQLAKEGITVKNIDITVGTNFEAVGEGLKAGTIDVGFIPAGTYVSYRKEAEILLTATRSGLNNTTNNPVDWNKNKPTKNVDTQVTSYVGIILAGPSEKGKAVSAKVNAGEKLTWEDLADLKWSVNSATSSAGYIYPTLWLNENYKKTIKDLGSNAILSDGYATSFARLASGQTDVLLVYGDGRLDYEKKWTSDFGRSASIWEETNVIGVTAPIYNDTISVSKSSKNVTPEFKAALQKSMMELAKTEEGKKVIKIYNHQGYQIAQDSEYDNEAKAQTLIKSLK